MNIEDCFEGECHGIRSKLMKGHVITDEELNEKRKELKKYFPKALKLPLSYKLKNYFNSLKEKFYT